MKESIIFSEQNLTEKVHYVYRVIIDGYYYIGKHSGFLNDLHTGAYKTSSKIIQEKIQNGFHFSKIKIIQVFSTEKEAYEFEESILTRVDARRHPKFLNQTNGGNGNYTLKQHTEETKEKISKTKKAQFDENTEAGIKRRKEKSEIQRNNWDENTEQGKKLRENQSNKRKEYFNPNTEAGIKRRKNMSGKGKAQFDPNTERGRINLEKQSQISSARFDKNTEEGRKRRESISEKAKERLQNRKNASILGELMFDEDFIKENFLIIDDKNNIRFLWSVYSKLSGFSKSFIVVHKREGKLSFLHGIESISISEEQESVKIEEIRAIL